MRGSLFFASRVSLHSLLFDYGVGETAVLLCVTVGGLLSHASSFVTRSSSDVLFVVPKPLHQFDAVTRETNRHMSAGPKIMDVGAHSVHSMSSLPLSAASAKSPFPAYDFLILKLNSVYSVGETAVIPDRIMSASSLSRCSHVLYISSQPFCRR